MKKPDDPKPLPGFEPHIAPTAPRRREPEVISAQAASAPLLHYRTAPSFQAYRTLHRTAVLVPLLPCVLKLLALLARTAEVPELARILGQLTRWQDFVVPLAQRLAQLGTSAWTLALCGLELLLALLAWKLPRAGGWMVAGWLWIWAAGLLVTARSQDTALLLLLLSGAALALLRLSREFHGPLQDWQR